MAYFNYKPTSLLYYYSDTAGFEGIIRSKKLWLSDVTVSNDPRELKLGQTLLARAIEHYNDNDVPGVSRRDMSGFVSDLLRFQRLSTCYTCCFAVEGDDLPLWREYADNGRGLSIGFRPTAMSSIPGRIQQVQYAEDGVEEYFKAVVIKAAMTMGRPMTIERVLASSEAFAAITALKHRSWKYEKEIRIVFNQRHESPDPKEIITQLVSLYPDQSIVKWREPLVRKSRGREVRYFDFPYGKYTNGKADPRRAIEVVYLGPRCEMSPEEVNALISAEGFEDFKVEMSECETQ